MYCDLASPSDVLSMNPTGGQFLQIAALNAFKIDFTSIDVKKCHFQ